MTRFPTAARWLAAAALALAGAAGANAATATINGAPPEFTSVFGEPLAVDEPREGETFTEAVEEFHQTGDNPYTGDEDAAAEGQRLFDQNCRACHASEARGGMGPSLVDDRFRHERAATDQGLFEIIHGGASGAMPAFDNQLDQDEILRIMAYIDGLRDD